MRGGKTMRRIYSTRFDLGHDPTKPPTLDDVVYEIRAWLLSKEGRPDEYHAPELQHDITTTGRSEEGDRSIETLRWKAGWALRWVQPGDGFAPRIASDVILRQSTNRLGIALSVGF